MKTRILTALVCIPLFLGVLYLGGAVWAAVIAALIAIGSFEMARIVKNMNLNISLGSVFAGELLMVALLYLHNEHWASVGMATSFLLIIFQGVFAYPKIRLEEMALSFMTVVYVGWSMCHLVLLEQQNVVLLVYLLLAIWGSDSGAYLAGRFFGKHKLAPQLSPKKTKEGAVGGVLCAVLLVLLFNVYLGEDALFNSVWTIIFGAIISIIGQIGDLAESMIKRFANVKDSGKILPGHGGILDRFDSIIMSAPAVCYLFIFVGI